MYVLPPAKLIALGYAQTSTEPKRVEKCIRQSSGASWLADPFKYVLLQSFANVEHADFILAEHIFQEEIALDNAPVVLPLQVPLLDVLPHTLRHLRNQSEAPAPESLGIHRLESWRSCHRTPY